MFALGFAWSDYKYDEKSLEREAFGEKSVLTILAPISGLNMLDWLKLAHSHSLPYLMDICRSHGTATLKKQWCSLLIEKKVFTERVHLIH